MDVSVPTIEKQNRKRVNRTSGKGKRTADDNGGKETVAKRQWIAFEDQKLVECLLEICVDPRFKNEAGFKSGFLKEVERMMAEKIPGCDLRVIPHIDSRYRLLRRQYRAINEMLGPNGSGFEWNDKEKYVDCDQDVFKDWVKSHPHAKGLRRKAFPHYEEFTIIWGKHSATGEWAEIPFDASEEIQREEVEGVDAGGLNGISVSAGSSVGEADVGVGGASPGVDGNGGTDGDVGASDASTKNKKRSRVELIEQLVGNMDRLINSYQDTNDNIAMLAQCFKHEVVAAERMEKVLEEIMKFEGLTISQKTKAAEIIISNPNKVVVFFNLDPKYRAEYVADQLV